MAVTYTESDTPGSSLATRNGTCRNWEEGPVDQLFEKYASPLFQPTKKGIGVYVDAVQQQIWVVEDGMAFRVAGRKGAHSYKDGPAKDAQFSLGWLGYNTAPAAFNKAGDLFVTEGMYGRIRKISKPHGSSWRQAVDADIVTVSTFTNGQAGIALAIDANDNLWTANYSLRRFAPDGTMTDLGVNCDTILPGDNHDVLNMDTIVVDGTGQIFARSNWGWASVFWQIDPVTGRITRVAGMTEEALNAYLISISRPDLINTDKTSAPVPIDGDNLTQTTFHTANLVALDLDANGKAIGFYTGNGDEWIVRRVDLVTKRTAHVMPDGTLQELTERYGGQQGAAVAIGPNRTIYTILQNNTYPGWTRIRTLSLQEVADPPPQPINGNLDGFQANGDAYGWASDGTSVAQTVVFSIDGIAAGSVVANAASTDVGPHRFFWPIPAQWKDGKVHSLSAFVGTFQLWGSQKTFTLQPQGEITMGQVNGANTYVNGNIPSTDTNHVLFELLDNAGVLVPGVTAQSVPAGTASVQFSNVPAPGTYKIRGTNMNQSNVAIGSAVISNSVTLAPGTITVQLLSAINATGS